MMTASHIALLFFPLLGAAATNAGSSIVIEDFASPLHSWKAMNDPVMGGESTSNVTIQDGVGLFDGQVVDVPFLKAPGFITMKTRGGSYPDVSTCTGLSLSLHAKEAYDGYRISFGNVHVPGGRFAFGYKANFDAPVGNKFKDVEISFSDFSAKWDDATGDQTVTCEEDSKYCPTKKALQNLKTMSIWGEGVAGNVHLEIKSITAVGCAAATSGADSKPQAPKESSSSDDDDDDEVILESFDDVKHAWTVLNDPVMGGESEGEVTLKDDYASFDGKVVDVPFLSAPGFISMSSSVNGTYPDASSCTALKLVLMATEEEYKGFRVSFGTVRLPTSLHAIGYKANFEAPYNTFGEVVIPFKEFSAAWDDATGDQIVTCAEEPKYCPDKATLENMETISLWGEGVAGNVHLKVKSISAVGCDDKIETEAQELDKELMVGMFSSHEKPTRAEPSGGHGRQVVFVAFVVAAIYVVSSKRRRSDAYDPVHGIDMNVMV